VPPVSGEIPIVPDHELVRQIGSGSSGDVWLARNALGTYRAVKVVYEKTFQHRRPYDREFNGVRNIEPVSRLHDGLVDILQVGRNDVAGYFYYVMELSDDLDTGQLIDPDSYVPRTLAHELSNHQRVPISECIRLGAAVASAIGFLHRKGLVHRDIKPANIIFVNGFPKVADIGLTTDSSEPYVRIGTDGFIPPEGAGTPQADIYSLGKVLYEMCTGRDRFDYPALPSPLENNAEDRDLIQFSKIVWDACRADVNRRYQSGEELMTALLDFQFSRYNPRNEKRHERALRMLSMGALTGGWWGLICIMAAWGVGVAIFVAAVWRLIWLLNHDL